MWAPLLVLAAVMITGLVLASGKGQVPESYFILFAVCSVLCALFVEPRGLFITVASFPLFFVLSGSIVGWLSSTASPTSNKKTKVITAIYPTIEHFMWLLIPFLITVVIAVFRWWKYKDELTKRQAREERERRRRKEADRANQESYSRLHERSAIRYRTPDDLQGSARDRRVPLPERRTSPRHYLDRDRQSADSTFGEQARGEHIRSEPARSEPARGEHNLGESTPGFTAHEVRDIPRPIRNSDAD